MRRFYARWSLGARAAALAAVYVLLSGGMLVALLLQLRAETLGAARRELGALAQLAAGHTFEVARAVEEPLRLAALTLSLAMDAAGTDGREITAMLQGVVRNAPILQDVVVLDSQGRVVHEAGGTGEIGQDFSRQPFFAGLRSSPQRRSAITAAFRRSTAAGSTWSIPVAQAWQDGSGTFAGVVAGFVDPQYFEKAWTFDAELKELAITLAAADGTVIVRSPFADGAIGRPLVAAGDLQRDTTDGTLRAASAADGRERLFASRRIAGLPDLMIVVSQPVAVVLAEWRRVAQVSTACWLAASLALGLLGLRLMREMKARGLLEGRYAALFDSIPHPVIVCDAAWARVLAFNQAAARQYGWRDGPADRPPLPADLALLRASLPQLSSLSSSTLEGRRHRDARGELIDVDVTARLVDYDGAPAVLIIAVDVTARMKAERARQAAEEQLRQAQRLEALGRLTGGIAHDFNNMLMVVQGHVEAMLERSDLDEEMTGQLRQVAGAAQRGEELTRQMLAFSRRQPLRPRPTDLNDVIAGTGKLLRRTLGERIEVDSLLADDLWPVDIDRAQFETTLVHLCLNARDSMPDGGRLLIETRNVPQGETGAERLAGDGVEVTVSDTGVGIAPEDVGRIFEPYFSTKTGGKHAGMGLSTVYGFISQSGGEIAVASEPGRGTVVRILLPRAATAVVAALDRAEPLPMGGGERVLVVEDDEDVRASVVRQVRSLGYAVDAAADGESGLAAFEKAGQPYDLLLSDVIMPGAINGRELGEEVARRWPDTRIVYMSGYTDNAFGDRAVLLLAKPFRKSDLARMLRSALDGGMHATAA